MGTTTEGARKGAIKRLNANRTAEFYIKSIADEKEKEEFQANLKSIVNAKKAKDIETALINDIYDKLNGYSPTKEEKKFINTAKKNKTNNTTTSTQYTPTKSTVEQIKELIEKLTTTDEIEKVQTALTNRKNTVVEATEKQELIKQLNELGVEELKKLMESKLNAK